MPAQRYGAGGYGGGASRGGMGSLFAGFMEGWDGASKIFDDYETLSNARKFKEQAEEQERANKKQAASEGKPGLAEALLQTPDTYGGGTTTRTGSDPYYGIALGKGSISPQPITASGAPATAQPAAAPPAETPAPTVMPEAVTTYATGRAAAFGGGGDAAPAAPPAAPPATRVAGAPLAPAAPLAGGAPLAPAAPAAGAPTSPRAAVSGSGGGPGDHTVPTEASAEPPKSSAIPTFGTQPSTRTAMGGAPSGAGTTIGTTSTSAYAPDTSSAGLGQSLLTGDTRRRRGLDIAPEQQQQALETAPQQRQQRQSRTAQAPPPVLLPPMFDALGNPIILQQQQVRSV